MRGSLLESDKPHQDVALTDKQIEMQRKINNPNEFHQESHHHNLPGPTHSINNHQNRQVGDDY